MITDKYAIQVMSSYVHTLQIYFFLKQRPTLSFMVMGATQENYHQLSILSVEFYRVYAL